MEKTELVQFKGENISLGALGDKLQNLGRDWKIKLNESWVTWAWLVKKDGGFYLYINASYLYPRRRRRKNDVYECRNTSQVEALTNQFVLN